MLLVVQHADAGDKGSWDGPDVLRPLSPAGRRQAKGLEVRWEDNPVDRGLTPVPPRCWRWFGIGGCRTRCCAPVAR